MDEMDRATQENSENAEDLLTIASTLQDNSNNLRTATLNLNKIVIGEGYKEKGNGLKVLKKKEKKKGDNDDDQKQTQETRSTPTLQAVEEVEPVKDISDIDPDDDLFKPAV